MLMIYIKENLNNKNQDTLLTDKEETGSDGNTGLQSSYLKYFIFDFVS